MLVLVHTLKLNPESSATWAIQLVGLSFALLGGLWAYTRYALERGLFPPVQFSIDCGEPGSFAGCTIVEILLHMRNLGSSTLIAHNIRVDIRYLTGDDE